MSRLCNVAYCRYNKTHVTMGHLCGRCKKYGHGDVECLNDGAIQCLYRMYNEDVVPNYMICTVADCMYKHFHTSAAHHCPICKERSAHTLTECPKNQQYLESISTYKLLCPICRADNIISIMNNKKILGLTDKCCVCMDNNVEVLLPNCFHCCLCLQCLKTIAGRHV